MAQTKGENIELDVGFNGFSKDFCGEIGFENSKSSSPICCGDKRRVRICCEGRYGPRYEGEVIIVSKHFEYGCMACEFVGTGPLYYYHPWWCKLLHFVLKEFGRYKKTRGALF